MAFMAAAATGAAAAGSIGGALISSGATKDAAQMQADAARHAADLQYQEYQQTREDQQPWRQAGAGALSQMQDPYFQKNFGMSDFQEDPGYQFRMQQGMDALQNSAAARGGLMGGNTLKGITDYGQNFASNEYQNAYNRFNNNQSGRFNRLASLAGVGQTANNAVGAAGMNMANNVGNIETGAANAAGAAGIAQGNIWGNTLSGIGNNVMQAGMMSKYGGVNNNLYGNNNYGGSQQFSDSVNGTLDATPQLQMPSSGGGYSLLGD